MATVTITTPDDQDQAWSYVTAVSEQIVEGYTSGHVDAERHWTSDLPGH